MVGFDEERCSSHPCLATSATMVDVERELNRKRALAVSVSVVI
jgi:hypothetical protein